jgi:predicted transcriptional regulator
MNKIVYAALLIGLTATAVSAQTSDQLATDIQAVDSAIGNINAALKQVTADAPNYLDTYQAVLGSSSNQTEAYATYQFCQGPNNNQIVLLS